MKIRLLTWPHVLCGYSGGVPMAGGVPENNKSLGLGFMIHGNVQDKEGNIFLSTVARECLFQVIFSKRKDSL